MTAPQPQKNAGWFTGRTRLVTIVSILGVGLAGASAVSANIGILDSASDSPVGNISAAGDLATPATQVLDVYLPATTDATTTTTSTPAVPAPSLPTTDSSVQQFAVDVAGTVAVSATESGIRLDAVSPAPGWTWTLTQSDPATLMVTMTNGTRVFEFTATRGAGSTVIASVSEPIMSPAPAATAGGEHEDDGYEDDDHDEDDDHEDDDHDEDEDHDDHEEYEGGEDDD